MSLSRPSPSPQVSSHFSVSSHPLCRTPAAWISHALTGFHTLPQDLTRCRQVPHIHISGKSRRPACYALSDRLIRSARRGVREREKGFSQSVGTQYRWWAKCPDCVLVSLFSLYDFSLIFSNIPILQSHFSSQLLSASARCRQISSIIWFFIVAQATFPRYFSAASDH